MAGESMQKAAIEEITLELFGEIMGSLTTIGLTEQEKGRLESLNKGNFSHLALSRLAANIYAEADKEKGSLGEDYERVKGALIKESVDNDLGVELLIDARVEEITTRILGEIGVASDAIKGIMGHNTAVRAAIIACAKYSLRGAMSGVRFDEGKLAEHISKVGLACRARVGSSEVWFGSVDEKKAIAAAEKAWKNDYKEYERKVLNVLSVIDLQEEEVARRILGAARVSADKINEILKDEVERKAVLGIAAAVIKKAYEENKGVNANAAPLTESITDKYVIEAAENLIGQVGLRSESWWQRPAGSSYSALSNRDKKDAQAAAKKLFEAEMTHEGYDKSVANTLHQSGAVESIVGRSANYESKGVLHNFVNVAAMTAVGGGALINAPVLAAMASAVPPLNLTVAAASFAWMVYSRHRDDGSNVGYTTVIPLIAMALTCPAAATFSVVGGFATGAFRFDGNSYADNLRENQKWRLDFMLSSAATAVMLYMSGVGSQAMLVTAVTSAPQLIKSMGELLHAMPAEKDCLRPSVMHLV